MLIPQELQLSLWGAVQFENLGQSEKGSVDFSWG